MLSSILTNIITQEFDACEAARPNINNKAMLITFASSSVPRFDVAATHYHTDLLIYVEPNSNYVGVYERDWWTPYYGKGKEFIGTDPFKCVAYHDSCWRNDGVGKFINVNEKKLICLDFIASRGKGWYQTIQINDAMQRAFKEIRKRKYE